MISTKNLAKSYGEKKILENISVEIKKHAVTTLIGSNGAGKSTLLSVISRLITGEGDVKIDGISLKTYKNLTLSRKLATLRQTNNINVRLTVRELVSFGRYPYSRTRLNNNDEKIVDEAIEYMNLNNLANRFIDQLSGGERQRAFIAMIIAQDTEYIMLDEPLNNLDMKHSVQIMKLLRKLADEKNKTIILVLHDIHYASFYSDYIISMKDGKIVGHGTTDEMINSKALKQVYDMDIDICDIDGDKVCMYFK